MNKEQIKSAILKTAGNPESGAIADLVDQMVEAILDIDNSEVKKFNPVSETRVIESKEIR
jgi:hypothetical protein